MVQVRPPVVWRSPSVRIVLAAIPAWFTLAVLVFNVAWRIKILVGMVLAVTCISPAAGLLAVAALAPLGHLIMTGLGVEPFRIAEAIVLAFLLGWLLRAMDDRPGPQVSASVGWLFALTVVASVVVQAWQLGQYRGELADTFRLIFFAYYQIGDRMGFVEAARLLEGLALAAVAVTLFRQRPRLAVTLPAALTAAGIPAAIASIVVWRQTGDYRVSGHVADVNAAGSYFAMLICLELGMALRARGRERVWWIAAAAANGVGLWFSESRTALAAVGVGLAGAIGWYGAVQLKPLARTVVVSAMVLAAVGVGVHRAQRENFFGVDYRQQFNATSLRMVKARPFLGVGVGRYYPSSPLFLSPQLAWYYGFENAHNNFLHIAAELGLIGCGLFLAWLAAGFAAALRAIARDPRDARLLGLTSGVAVFLGTCATSHPLLVPEVAFPFWIQFGLMWALAGSTLLNTSVAERHVTMPPLASRAWPHAAAFATAACVLVVAPVSAWRGPIDPPTSRDVDGFYDWETSSDGVRFRWTERFASLFVPADVTRVQIPVRAEAFSRVPRQIGVDVMIGGAPRLHANVDTAWYILDVPLPDTIPPTRFRRIDLRVDRTWQPALYIAESHDMRAVGVQVGEMKVFRER